jgi:copper transport protein
MSWGWIPAALGVIVGVLRPALFGQWSRMLNPMHSLGGGLWIGTLFLMLVTALPLAMRVAHTPERRAALTMRLVGAFSPLALASAAMLTVFGVLTAARHLKHPSALWTTPYGIALIVKLCAVSAVLALGAWNWRRLKPRLGEPEALPLLRRSALTEVAAAGVVLAVTAVLVSLPSP